MSNSNIAVVYFSGYGHTKVVAETFANEINAQLIQIDQEGNITEQDWETLNNAKVLCLVRRPIWVQHHGNLKIC